jgi:hypothetical protein
LNLPLNMSKSWNLEDLVKEQPIHLVRHLVMPDFSQPIQCRHPGVGHLSPSATTSRLRNPISWQLSQPQPSPRCVPHSLSDSTLYMWPRFQVSPQDARLPLPGSTRISQWNRIPPGFQPRPTLPPRSRRTPRTSMSTSTGNGAMRSSWRRPNNNRSPRMLQSRGNSEPLLNVSQMCPACRQLPNLTEIQMENLLFWLEQFGPSLCKAVMHLRAI